MISVVCVYNNEILLNDSLLKSLINQTAEFELLKIDNTKGEYKSAAKALNYGGKKAKGKYIMFVHQDVDLLSDTWLDDAEQILDSLQNFGIAGVAGMSENGRTYKERGRNVIISGDEIWVGSNSIQKPELVQTLDECLVIIPKSVFNVLQFDEEICDNWHLYAVDYCLSVRKQEYGTYAIPMCIHHKSKGTFTTNSFETIINMGKLPPEYYQNIGKILKKHKSECGQIYTTCGEWSTSSPVFLQRIVWLTKGGLRIMSEKIRLIIK